MSTTRLTSGRIETAISSPTSNCGQTTQVVAKDHKKTTALVATKKGQQAGFHESKRNTKGNLEAFVSISPCTNVDEPTRGDKIQLRRGSCREDPPPSYDVAVKSSLNATFHYPTALQAPSAVTRAPELLPKHNNTTHRNGHEWRQRVPPTSSNVPMSGSRIPLPHRKLNSYSNNLSEDLKEYVPSSTTPTVINSSSKPCIDPNVSIGATNSNQPESHMKSALCSNIGSSNVPRSFGREEDYELSCRSLVDLTTTQANSDGIHVSLPSSSIRHPRNNYKRYLQKRASLLPHAEEFNAHDYIAFEAHNPQIAGVPFTYQPSDRLMRIPNPTNSEKAWRSSGCIDEDQWCHPPNPYKGATHQDTATVSSPVFFTRQRLSREICRDFLKGRCSRQPCPYLHENPLASHQEQQLWREYCRDFLKGRCSRQPCPYLHNYPPGHQELQPQGEYCRDFLNGQCYRHPCPYVHGNHPDRHQSQPLPKGYCRSYLRGQCYRRPCPYIHDDPPDSETEFATYHSRALSAMSTESFARASVMPAPSTTETESLGCSFSSTSSTLASDTGQPFPNKQTTPESPLVVTLSDHTKVTLTKGFEVQEVKTGFETRWIHVGNVISNAKTSTLTKMFAAFGHVEALHVSQRSDAKGLVQVQFSTVAEALEAVTKLNGSTFAGKKLTAKLSINNSGTGNATLKDNSVRLEWHAPARLGYAGYATLDAAMAVVKNADGFKLEQYLISAALYDGLPAVGAYNVIFRNLPPSSTQKDLEQFGAAESIMLDRPNYTSADSATKFIRKLSEECGEILRFYTLPPPFQDGMIKAWVDFASPREAQIAVEHIDGRRPVITGKTAISVCHLQTVSYSLPRHVYDKMSSDITLLSSSWQNKHGTVTIEDQSLLQKGYITIKLSSVNTAQLSRLKHDFERLLRGEVVLFDKKPVWDGFFARPCGLAYLKALERRYNGMEVQRELQRRTITLFGPIEKRQDIRREIVKKYMALRAQQFWTIPVTGRLIGLFVCSDLIKLQEDLGPENCILDLKIRALVIRGNEQVFQLACKVVRLAQSRQADEHQRPPSVMCPVCLSEPILPTTLDCGHQWCQSCLCDYLVAAKDNKFFPLTCLGGDASCTHRISLTVAQKLLSAAEFEAIAEASFWKYVHSRPEEFFHCPTPDCSQVYRSAPPDAVLQCPSCLVRICPACHVEYHDGITCEERDVAEDKLFTEWTENHDVKSCPGCKAMIERSAGCNHMTCTRCQTHICWECLATFPKGEGIYDHMRTFHGGIGL